MCDLEALIAAENDAQVAADPFRRLSALLPRDSSVADAIAVRLKLSNKARKRLGCAAQKDLGANPQALAYRVGTDCAVDRLLLAGRTREARDIADWKVPRLPIGGGALIARGLTPGPVVARTLRSIEDQWVDAGFPTGGPLDQIVASAVKAAR